MYQKYLDKQITLEQAKDVWNRLNEHYDYLIAGSGLYGAAFARRAVDCGKKCLVIDRRPQLGGNVFCENVGGITVHKYGAHIFHTANERVWEFVNRYADFLPYTHRVTARNGEKLYCCSNG